ncbi:hypothetical protein CVIRNUC_010553 [Coccomyxa viridis]|uniref:Uncharacterized protein n=1 Tax=Coccomyxa viridis TaxID=1274662 RepID=A0AAV1IM63_9CHLO|nr:hypothetical protein CVIRNUC_010553 [Coccomyxa viridis]
MSWIWEKSATWRWLVAVTKRSPAAMTAFTIGMCVVPYYAGQAVMSGTSMVTEQGTSLEQQLRARQTLEHKVLAKANRERLRVLLGEAEKGGLRDNERYAAALRGESLGTHSRGTTVGAQNIRDSRQSSSAWQGHQKTP